MIPVLLEEVVRIGATSSQGGTAAPQGTQVLNVIALVFAGFLVAGVAVAVGYSSVGPSIGMTAGELQKLAPNYWNNAASKMSYNIIQAPSLIGPAWTPDELPGTKSKKPPKKLPVPTSPAPFTQPQLTLDDDFAAFPVDDTSDTAGFWEDSPSPLGRVA
jgi:hypothetical protein